MFLLRSVAQMLGGDYKEEYLKRAKCQIKSTQTLFIKKLFFLKRSAVFLSVISEIQAQHPDLKTFECCRVSCRRRWETVIQADHFFKNSYNMHISVITVK